jgi:nitrogenase molybdenum-iron protein alpha/beta subunit
LLHDFARYLLGRENITRDTWEPRRFLRTLGANAARGIPENRSILPENITSYLRTAPSAHAW